MPTPRPAAVPPQQYADAIRAALAALNAVVEAAARDGVGVTYDQRVGLLEGKLPPATLTAQIWCAL